MRAVCGNQTLFGAGFGVFWWPPEARPVATVKKAASEGKKMKL
jgi:arabinogalactan endo-1,4-beta-galactosidase